MTEVWHLKLPYRTPPLHANQRHPHWAVERNLQNNVQKATWALAKHHQIPHLDAITAILTWYKGNNRRADPDNIAATLKPALDGLKKAGCITDDHAGIVLRTEQRIVYKRNDTHHQGPALILTIRDVSPLAVPEGT